jgi:hypothetical protein
MQKLVYLILILALSGCGRNSTAESGEALSPTQLKYRLADAFTIFFCDPDHFPISRGDEAERAVERFPAIAADAEKFGAILTHLGWSGRTTFPADEKLAIYREDKRLASIVLEPSGDAYSFSLRAGTEEQATAISGTITRAGRVNVRQRTASLGGCPICLDERTRIATPSGEIAVRHLRPGMVVWTESPEGLRIAAPLVRTGHTPMPAEHEFVRLELSDGRLLHASPGHPAADAKPIGELRAGDVLDGARVVSAERHAATGSATYDVLPDGDTGIYWANGIPLRSTLSQP